MPACLLSDDPQGLPHIPKVDLSGLLVDDTPVQLVFFFLFILFFYLYPGNDMVRPVICRSISVPIGFLKAGREGSSRVKQSPKMQEMPHQALLITVLPVTRYPSARKRITLLPGAHA